MFPVGLFFALAITISNVSPTTINTTDDVITISATASGLTPSKQYLQAAFTREGDTTNYLGFTKNLSGEWYPYKSSPISSELNSYFYNFTPSGASWSGEIQAKINPDDSGFAGPGNYLVKLFKYITSTGSPSTNTFSILVNIASVSGQITPTSTPAPSSPGMTISVGSAQILGQEFNVSVKLENFDGNREYYLKLRAGTSENEMTKGRTRNGDAFLGDNESWSNFPVIKTSDTGFWEGKIIGRIDENKPTGQYFLRLRVHKKEADTFFDSPVKTVSLNQRETYEPAKETVGMSPRVTIEFLDEDEEVATEENNLVLGEQTSTQPAILPRQESAVPSSKPLITVGLGAISTSVIFVFLSKLYNRLK